MPSPIPTCPRLSEDLPLWEAASRSSSAAAPTMIAIPIADTANCIGHHAKDLAKYHKPERREYGTEAEEMKRMTAAENKRSRDSTIEEPRLGMNHVPNEQC